VYKLRGTGRLPRPPGYLWAQTYLAIGIGLPRRVKSERTQSEQKYSHKLTWMSGIGAHSTRCATDAVSPPLHESTSLRNRRVGVSRMHVVPLTLYRPEAFDEK